MTEAPAVLYARAGDVIVCEVAGETVLLQARTWQYLDIDAVGAAIWARIEPPCGLDALVVGLRAAFEIDEARCRDETRAFLDQMVAVGVVEALPRAS